MWNRGRGIYCRESDHALMLVSMTHFVLCLTSWRHVHWTGRISSSPEFTSEEMHLSCPKLIVFSWLLWLIGAHSPRSSISIIQIMGYRCPHHRSTYGASQNCGCISSQHGHSKLLLLGSSHGMSCQMIGTWRNMENNWSLSAGIYRQKIVIVQLSLMTGWWLSRTNHHKPSFINDYQWSLVELLLVIRPLFSPVERTVINHSWSIIFPILTSFHHCYPSRYR